MADEKDLKVAFRAFAKRYHPDRVGKEFESRFIAVRDAYDALKNPVTRFAYDRYVGESSGKVHVMNISLRFGFDALGWRDCITPKDYLRRGIQNASGFYIGSALILTIVTLLMPSTPVAFVSHTNSHRILVYSVPL